MQAFRIAPAVHHAASELVDDDDLALADDIVLVALEQLVRAQALIDVMHERDILRLVERAIGEHAGLGQQLFHMLIADFRQIDGALLLVELVIVLVELGDQLVDRIVEIGFVIRMTGDDERRARLVDEDRIHLVDDGVDMRTLHHLRQFVFHIVAQIVEAELVVGAVGDVAAIGVGALLVRYVVDDDADAHAEEAIDPAHPLGVAAGEIVVDGDDMDAAAAQRVEIDGERRDQRLALAGAHLGDRALVQDHAADELHVEMPLAEHALGRLADRGEGRDEQIVEPSAVLQRFAELLGAGAQRLIGQSGELDFQSVDRLDLRLIGLEPAIIGRAENLLGESAEHAQTFPDEPPAMSRRRPPFRTCSFRFPISFRKVGERNSALALASAARRRSRDKRRPNPCQ